MTLSTVVDIASNADRDELDTSDEASLCRLSFPFGWCIESSTIAYFCKSSAVFREYILGPHLRFDSRK
jgi:hypothetical protein